MSGFKETLRGWLLSRDDSYPRDVEPSHQEDSFEDIAATDKGREISYNVFLTQFQNSRSEADKAMIAGCSAGMGFLLLHLSNPDRKIGPHNAALGFLAVVLFALAIVTLIVGFRKTSSYLDNNIKFMRFGEEHVSKAIESQFNRMVWLDKIGWLLAGTATILAIFHFAIFRMEVYHDQATAPAAAQHIGKEDRSRGTPAGRAP